MEFTNEHITGRIKAQFGDKILFVEEPFELLTITAAADINVELVSFLKNDPELQVIFLTDLCGIHYPENKGEEIGVICHLHSLVHNFRIRLKFFIPEAAPSIRSLVPVFPGANWMERETFDFYGIKFEGHPNLKRVLNVDDMTYHPMLKQYPLEDPTREDKNDTYFGR
ncbi:MAG: NADH-quinone oxidoreductase subunit C [Bacteroidota bacterium]